MSKKAGVITLIVAFIICLGMIVYGTISDGVPIREIMPRIILMGTTAVILIVRMLSNSPKEKTVNKTEMQADIVKAKEWIVSALTSSGYQADFSMESLKDIDRFFDEQNNEKGILAQNTGRILFGLGVYVGETIIANVGGEWSLDDCTGETNIAVMMDEKTKIFPVIRVMSRYQYGKANSIYAYGQGMVKK